MPACTWIRVSRGHSSSGPSALDVAGRNQLLCGCVEVGVIPVYIKRERESVCVRARERASERERERERKRREELQELCVCVFV